jgi:hypothetical protein
MSTIRKPVVENVQAVQVISQIVKDMMFKGYRKNKEFDPSKKYTAKVRLSYTDQSTKIERVINMSFKFAYVKELSKPNLDTFKIAVFLESVGNFIFNVEGERSFIVSSIIEQPYDGFFATLWIADSISYEVLEKVQEVE